MCALNLDFMDYLLIGHLTEDLQADGSVALGGTVAYSGLTAQALGHKAAILSSCAKSTSLEAIISIPLEILEAEKTSQFRNISSESGRLQYLFSQAKKLVPQMLPDQWANPAIVHIAPVFNDVDPAMLGIFPNSLRCLTPQGWMRDVDDSGKIIPKTLQGLDKWLSYAHAVVLSKEDLQGDLAEAERLAKLVPILVVTDRENGAQVFFGGTKHHFPAPKTELIDDTGSGDIFAACFFHYLWHHQNAWQAARFAVELASRSITRKGLAGVPNQEEIQKAHQLALEQAVYG